MCLKTGCLDTYFVSGSEIDIINIGIAAMPEQKDPKHFNTLHIMAAKFHMMADDHDMEIFDTIAGLMTTYIIYGL